MRRSLRSVLTLALALITSACVPPREHVDGTSADGLTRVALDLRPAGGDSVRGSGTVQVAGHPRTVVVLGRWTEIGDGLRSLEALLQVDTVPGERWALEWSPVTLNGSLRPADGWSGDSTAAVSLNTP